MNARELKILIAGDSLADDPAAMARALNHVSDAELAVSSGAQTATNALCQASGYPDVTQEEYSAACTKRARQAANN